MTSVFSPFDFDGSLELASEAASVGQSALSTGRIAQHSRARRAHNHGLGVRENRRDDQATRALHVHEERVGRLHQPLELMLALLVGSRRIQEVLLQKHVSA